MLLLLFAGVGTGSAPPTPPKKVIGWPNAGRLWHDPADLERRLARQRGFGRQWFEDFVTAQNAAQEKIEETKDLGHQGALEQAASLVYDAVDWAITNEAPPPIDLIAALRAATLAKTFAEARAIALEIASDDEETAAAALLLH